MTPEQEQFWNILKLDPAQYAHDSGKELKRKRFNHRTANKHIEFIMANFDQHQAVSIVKTWLNVYQLPLDASKLDCFEQFHNTYGSYIRSHSEQLKAYT